MRLLWKRRTACFQSNFINFAVGANRINGYLRDKINAKPWLDIAAISIQPEVIEIVT